MKKKTASKRRTKTKLIHTKRQYRSFRKDIKSGARALEKGDQKKHRKAVDSATNKALMFPIAFGKDIFNRLGGNVKRSKKGLKKK